LVQILSQKVTAKQLLQYIPEEKFAGLIKETGVDYQVKKLFGKNLFYLLLYGLLETTRVSQRSLEDVFKSNKFKLLFNLIKPKDFRYNALSQRLANINAEFFESVYGLIYDDFSQAFSDRDALKYKLTRVDSTMVCEAANKLEAGMTVGKKKNGKKQIKYTISLTDLLPSSVEVFTQQSALSEDITIPQAILKDLDKKLDHVFVFDRGVHGRKYFCELDENGVRFITRINENSRHKVLKSIKIPKNLKVGNLTILSDEKVYLISDKKVFYTPFRLIKTINSKNEPIWFLTNIFEFSISEVIWGYKRRWDIEVFNRFIKQELNFKHFLSTNLNGIKVVLYMTLILAMLILIYKKFNEVGYKTAKRRFYYEVDDLILYMAIVASGGNPRLVLRC
jgi:hypothetical protein